MREVRVTTYTESAIAFIQKALKAKLNDLGISSLSAIRVMEDSSPFSCSPNTLYNLMRFKGDNPNTLPKDDTITQLVVDLGLNAIMVNVEDVAVVTGFKTPI